MQRPAEERLSILKQLLRLAQEQRGALRADDVAQFEALLGQRQRLLYVLATEGDQLVPANVIPFPGRGRSGDDQLALAALVQGIQEIDRENGSLLQTKLAEVGASLRRLHQDRQAARGYAPPPRTSAGLEKAG